MAISNKQVLTQKEPDPYKYYTPKEKEAAQQFENWDRSDIDTYVQNKLKWENQDKYAIDPTKLSAENQALREKYGMTEDKYSYNDLGRLGFDAVWGDPYAKQPNTSVLTSPGGMSKPSIELPDRPTMRSGRSMADLLGVVYDYDTIEDMYKDAVDKKYANLNAEVRRTQDMYYDSVANSADTLMGAFRRGDRDAVRTGTASGTQAATELSALLGASAEAGQGATELAQARDDLVRKREEDLANVTKDALKYYNDLGINLGQLSASELNALVTAYASEVATLGGIYNTDVLAGVERDRIGSQERIANADRISRENIASWGNASNEEIAKITGISQKEVEEIRAAYNKEIADINGKYNVQVSKNYNSGGGSGSGTEGLSPADRVSTLFGIIEKNTPDPDKGFEGNPQMVENAYKELETLLGIELLPKEIIKSMVPATNTATTTRSTFDEETERLVQQNPAHEILIRRGREEVKKYMNFK